MEREFRTLDGWSLAIGLFVAVLAIAALVELVYAGQAVQQYYADRAIAEAVAREHFMPPPPDYPLGAFFDALMNPAIEVIAETGRSTSAWPAWVTAPVLAAIVMGVALIGLVVAMLGWVWRAHANLVLSGARPSYGPDKALVAYLLPFANLVLAPDAMRELYNRSHGEPEELVDSAVDDVTAWFAAMISGTVIMSLLIAKYMLDLGSNLAIVTPLWVEFAMAGCAMVLLLSAAFLFFRLTRIVARAQRETLVLMHEPAPQSQTHAPQGVRLIGG